MTEYHRNPGLCMADTLVLIKMYILFPIQTAYYFNLLCDFECSMLNMRLE